MTAEKSEAIVLRSVAWSETSLIVTLFTRSHGKVSAVAKGARRLKSPFDTSLDLLAKSYALFLMKSSDSLDLLTETKLLRRFRSGQKSLASLYCGYYLAELVFSLTENHLPIERVFEKLDSSLLALDEGANPAKVMFLFELNFLRELGQMPSFELCAGCGNSVESGRNQGMMFGIEAGGVLCNSCLGGQHQVLRLQSETLWFLSKLSVDAKLEDSWSIPESVGKEMRFVMERFISHLADRRLRLMDFLEELKF